ncbi:PmeII family type II restriction endonuclease [Arthrobacter sp. UM1]|uniref:PmeII family type II restriction endonuclease n=1 Tax=Arthrobacter sp. UM1 TaxID=2766776 RepID=UPI001CF6243C|nr:PmeII family type II restriction endonuclease [Arthrobacter sp. UM1]MCB4208909.1 hypothetical protein [Arthrobacter sp. UM1]
MSNEPVTEIPDELSDHQDVALRIIKEYQERRIGFYEKLRLKELLEKDIAMFAARGCTTALEYLTEAFHAKESSSEETVMGTHWQRILSAISADTLDTGDLTTQRDGALWVLELKSQTNTTNSSSFVQELRGLRTRMEELKGRRRASGQAVKAAMCIVRDGKVGKDETRVYKSPDLQRENRDLDGFEYRYITGAKFWQWLAGFNSSIGLLMPLSNVDGSRVQAAREKSLARLSNELTDQLSSHDLGGSLDDLVVLRDRIL